MSEQQTASIPLWALLLDVIGTLILAAGLVGMFVDAPFLTSLPFNLNNMAVVLIILGVLLMVPLIVVLVQRAVAPR